MNSKIRELLNRLNGKYGQKYGHLIDDWTSMVLEEIHENFAQLTRELRACKDEISAAKEKIKTSQRIVQLGSTRDAFYFGLGVAGPVCIAAIIVGLLIFWYAYTAEGFEKRKVIIDTYENVIDYALLMQNGRIIEREGAKYLVLRPVPSKGDIIIGEEYVFDQKNKQVLVPLGRK